MGESLESQYRAEREAREARNAEANYTEKCAWCDEPAEDALGLGWPLCPECGEIYGAAEPPSVKRERAVGRECARAMGARQIAQAQRWGTWRGNAC